MSSFLPGLFSSKSSPSGLLSRSAFASALSCITQIIHQITIEITNPKCRLYWCLIEFIDWRYSQSCWYFRTLLKRPSTFSPVHSPLTSLCEKVQFYTLYTVCNEGKRIGLRGEHILGVIHYVFDQIPNLQNCFATPNKT
jgi:hypothetical protein